MISQAMKYGTTESSQNMLERILVVDDEPDINTIAKISLESFGKYEVETCSSGIEALKKVTWFQPNIILLDVMMPFMDGEETIKKLQREQATSSIPVVFVTAKISSKDIARYKELGAVDVIPKPFDPIKLPQQVKQIWTDFHSSDDTEKEIESAISKMRGEFISSFHERYAELEYSFEEYMREGTKESLLKIYNVVHKITGLSGTLELKEVYSVANKLETILFRVLDSEDTMLSPEMRRETEALIENLKQFG